METLPPELLSKILLHLPAMDRLDSSLTCRRWAEAMTSSQLLHDVWLNIAGFEMEAARSVLMNSRRHYTRLVLFRADLSKFDSEFWANIGADLRVLELERCSWSTDVFYAILQKCTKLKSLKIEESLVKTSIDDFVPPEGVCRERLRESLSHLEHLNLDIDLTADILDLLLGLMPNVKSIRLSYFFGRNSDFLKRLPSILRKYRIIRTGADFCLMRLTSEDIIELVDGTLGTLEELRINAEELTGGAIDAILRCTTLRSLELTRLKASSNLSDLEKLVSNFPPDIEILSLETSEKFKFEDMVHLVELRKLRTFSLVSPYLNRFSHESLRRLEGMSTLGNLDLRGFDVDKGAIQRLGRLTNLQSLALSACPDSEYFEAICKNFGELTELHLGHVGNLTDADGSKLCHFKLLRYLSFEDGYGFTDETFKRGVGSRNMKFLVIEGCSITDTGLMSLASHHNCLETFKLSFSPNITNAGVLALLRNEPRMKWLSMKVCLPLDMSLRSLCPRLRI